MQLYTALAPPGSVPPSAVQASLLASLPCPSRVTPTSSRRRPPHPHPQLCGELPGVPGAHPGRRPVRPLPPAGGGRSWGAGCRRPRGNHALLQKCQVALDGRALLAPAAWAARRATQLPKHALRQPLLFSYSPVRRTAALPARSEPPTPALATPPAPAVQSLRYGTKVYTETVNRLHLRQGPPFTLETDDKVRRQACTARACLTARPRGGRAAAGGAAPCLDSSDRIGSAPEGLGCAGLVLPTKGALDRGMRPHAAQPALVWCPLPVARWSPATPWSSLPVQPPGSCPSRGSRSTGTTASPPAPSATAPPHSSGGPAGPLATLSFSLGCGTARILA